MSYGKSNTIKRTMQLSVLFGVTALVTFGVTRIAPIVSATNQSGESMATAIAEEGGRSDAYNQMLREKSRLEGEVNALRSAARQYESEKNAIMNQVRTSVKAFDDYRQQTTVDVKRLHEEIDQMRADNKELRDALSKSQDQAHAGRTDNLMHVRDLQDEVAVYKETIALLQQDIENRQNDRILKEAAKLHYNVGNFYFRNTQYQDAAEEYKKALMYAPHDADAHYNLGVVSDEYLGDRPQALKHYKRYLSLNPGGEVTNQVEERILDLELYHTVLQSDKQGSENQIRWLEQQYRPDSKRFYGN